MQHMTWALAAIAVGELGIIGALVGWFRYVHKGWVDERTRLVEWVRQESGAHQDTLKALVLDQSQPNYEPATPMTREELVKRAMGLADDEEPYESVRAVGIDPTDAEFPDPPFDDPRNRTALIPPGTSLQTMIHGMQESGAGVDLGAEHDDPFEPFPVPDERDGL